MIECGRRSEVQNAEKKEDNKDQGKEGSVGSKDPIGN